MRCLSNHAGEKVDRAWFSFMGIGEENGQSNTRLCHIIMGSGSESEKQKVFQHIRHLTWSLAISLTLT